MKRFTNLGTFMNRIEKYMNRGYMLTGLTTGKCNYLSFDNAAIGYRAVNMGANGAAIVATS